jgi:hypothetical protein
LCGILLGPIQCSERTLHPHRQFDVESVTRGQMMIAAKLLQSSDDLFQGCMVEGGLQCVKFYEEAFCLFWRNSSPLLANQQ